MQKPRGPKPQTLNPETESSRAFSRPPEMRRGFLDTAKGHWREREGRGRGTNELWDEPRNPKLKTQVHVRFPTPWKRTRAPHRFL